MVTCPRCGKKFNCDPRDQREISANTGIIAGCEECTPVAPPGKMIIIRCARCNNAVAGWEVGGFLLCASCIKERKEEAKKWNPLRSP